MSLTTPVQLPAARPDRQERALDLVHDLRAAGSASQAASACSSAASSVGPDVDERWRGRRRRPARGRSARRCRGPRCRGRSARCGPVRACRQPARPARPAGTSVLGDVEAALDLGLGAGERGEQPVAQHAELQVVEERVHLVAVPGWTARSAGPSSSGTARSSSVSRRFCSTEDRCSRSFSPTLPLTVSTWSTSASSEPYSRTHLAAVFSPTLGMLGRLSLGSPRSAAKSGYCAGVRPYLVSTSSGVNRVMSETPLRG